MRELSIVELDNVSGGSGFFHFVSDVIGKGIDTFFGIGQAGFLGAALGGVRGAATGAKVTGMGQPGLAGVLGVITGTVGGILGGVAGAVAGALAGVGAGFVAGTFESGILSDQLNRWFGGHFA